MLSLDFITSDSYRCREYFWEDGQNELATADLPIPDAGSGSARIVALENGYGFSQQLEDIQLASFRRCEETNSDQSAFRWVLNQTQRSGVFLSNFKGEDVTRVGNICFSWMGVDNYCNNFFSLKSSIYTDNVHPTSTRLKPSNNTCTETIWFVWWKHLKNVAVNRSKENKIWG